MMVMETTMANAIFDFTADDGIEHTVWRVRIRFALCRRSRGPFLYIADGHHRAASAARARAELKEQSFGHTGDEEYNFFLAVMFPDDQLQILPYNVWCTISTGCRKEQFLAQCAKVSAVTEEEARRPRVAASGAYIWTALVYAHSCHRFARTAGNCRRARREYLQDRLLDPILGIKDVRTDKRIDFIVAFVVRKSWKEWLMKARRP